MTLAAKIARLRRRVGGDILIFVMSCLLLIYAPVILVFSVVSAFQGKWDYVLRGVLAILFLIAMSRLLFLVLHWWYHTLDQWFAQSGKK